MTLMNSDYYTAVSSFKSQAFDFSEETLLSSIQNNPKYQVESPGYMEFSYEEFIPFYSEQSASEICLTKLKAIPQCFFCGLIKTIYYLACALFCVIRDMASGETLACKANLFKAGRNFEASFGHFISLFHDRLGAYYVQRSNFYITCYDQFYEAINNKNTTNEKWERLRHEKLQKIADPKDSIDNDFDSESIVFLVSDLNDFKSVPSTNAKTLERHILAIYGNINKKIEEYNKIFPDFMKRLGEFCTNQMNIADKINIKEFLSSPVDQSPLSIYLMSDEELIKLTLTEFKKMNKIQKEALFTQISRVLATDEQHAEIINPIDLQELPLRFFSKLTVKEIELCKADIPKSGLLLLSESGECRLRKLHPEWKENDTKE